MGEALAGALDIAVLVFAVSSMLSVGLAHPFRDILAPLRELRKVLRALVVNFALVPLLAHVVLLIVPLERPLAIGIFLVATAAGAPFLIKLAQLARSDVPLSTTLLVVLLPATIVYMPIVVPFALPEAEVSATAIARPLVLTMLLPLVVGLAAHERFPSGAQRLQPFMSSLSTLALVVLVAATILADLPAILVIFRTPAILAALIVIGGAFAIGYSLGGPSRQSKEVLGLGAAQRNIGAATVVATQSAHDPDTLSMVVVTLLVSFAILFPIAGVMRKRRKGGALTHAHGFTEPERGAAPDQHAGHSVEMFRRKFWASLALTIPTVIWSEHLQTWLGYTAPAFPGSTYLPAVFGVAVYAYGGWPFLQGMARELRDRRPGMMTLISLAITVALLFSAAVTLGFRGMPLWWEVSTLVTIMLLGHWIEMRSIQQAKGALKALAKLLPSDAVRVIDDRTEAVPLSAIEVGDVVLVRPGASIPADGVVLRGTSAVNESMITGESRPVGKTEGATVIAGTVNGEGSLRVEVTRTGDHTALAGIMRLVAQAQSSRSRAQALADRAAFLLTLVAVGAGALTLAVWLAVGASADFAIERFVTVLVIACPHALGLAVPLVVAISTTLGAQSGLLVRDRRGLEEARRLSTVIFDKTGTLTLGAHRVVEITADGVPEVEALRLAAAVEHDSEHAIARAIVESAEDRDLEIPPAEDFTAIPGHGVSARVAGREIHVGGPALLRELGAEPAPALRAAAERAAKRGQTAIYLFDAGRALAVFAVADAIREESREAVRRLRDLAIEVIMLTGDGEDVARAVAGELGIDAVFAEVLPDQKAAVVRRLQREGRRVAMVGDGVNDAPALLTADVGIAVGAGTDVAVEAGDVVLVRSDPRDVPRIVELSRATYRKMVQNLWWAAGYNIIAIPLAAGVLARWGIILHPAIGAVLMSASTVIVAVNAQLLRRLPV